MTMLDRTFDPKRPATYGFAECLLTSAERIALRVSAYAMVAMQCCANNDVLINVFVGHGGRTGRWTSRWCSTTCASYEFAGTIGFNASTRTLQKIGGL